VRNAEGLACLVGDYFRVPVAVEQFIGHWMVLRERDLTRLGAGRGRLGRDALLGRRVWDRQHKFRLRLGPLGLHDYEALLPGGSGCGPLVAAVRNYVGDEYEWDARLLLHASEVPALCLGAGQRLGYTSWLGSRSSAQPAGDLVLDARRRGARFEPEQKGDRHE
jgi:type VI secretion system protein ImpH